MVVFENLELIYFVIIYFLSAAAQNCPTLPFPKKQKVISIFFKTLKGNQQSFGNCEKNLLYLQFFAPDW